MPVKEQFDFESALECQYLNKSKWCLIISYLVTNIVFFQALSKTTPILIVVHPFARLVNVYTEMVLDPRKEITKKEYGLKDNHTLPKRV